MIFVLNSVKTVLFFLLIKECFFLNVNVKFLVVFFNRVLKLVKRKAFMFCLCPADA